MYSLLRRFAFKAPPLHMFKRDVVNFDYDMKEEIVLAAFNQIYTIGINLPEHKNALNDSALDKLNAALNCFNDDDQYSAAVLHGLNGTLCSGLQPSTSIVKAQEVIKTMGKLRKPIIGAISGHTKFYGFQLAIMCDVRIMEETALFGLGHKKEKDNIFPLVSQRLVATLGISRALETALFGHSCSSAEALSAGLINRKVECGSGLGCAINLSQAVNKVPLESIIRDKKLILAFGMGAELLPEEDDVIEV